MVCFSERRAASGASREKGDRSGHSELDVNSESGEHASMPSPAFPHFSTLLAYPSLPFYDPYWTPLCLQLEQWPEWTTCMHYAYRDNNPTWGK